MSEVQLQLQQLNFPRFSCSEILDLYLAPEPTPDPNPDHPTDLAQAPQYRSQRSLEIEKLQAEIQDLTKTNAALRSSLKLANDAYEDERAMWKAEDDVLHERLAEWEDKMEVEYDKEQEMLAEIEELQGKLKEWEWKWERATGQVGSSSDEDEENEDEETQEAGDQEVQDTEMTFQDADGTEWEIVRI